MKGLPTNNKYMNILSEKLNSGNGYWIFFVCYASRGWMGVRGSHSTPREQDKVLGISQSLPPWGNHFPQGWKGKLSILLLLGFCFFCLWENNEGYYMVHTYVPSFAFTVIIYCTIVHWECFVQSLMINSQWSRVAFISLILLSLHSIFFSTKQPIME
jgi:hypothetical protein